jgi:hypothetical protein
MLCKEDDSMHHAFGITVKFLDIFCFSDNFSFFEKFFAKISQNFWQNQKFKIAFVFQPYAGMAKVFKHEE